MNSRAPTTLPLPSEVVPLRPVRALPELQVDDRVSVSVPLPSGPEGMTARVTEIDGEYLILEVNLGSGWKVVVEAHKDRIVRSKYTDMWALEE